MTVCLYVHEETVGVKDLWSTHFGYVPVDINVRGTGSVDPVRFSSCFEPTTHPPGIYEEDSEPRPPSFEPPRDQLQYIRDMLGINVSDLASVLGVSRPTVYAWLEGDEPSPENYTHIVRLKRIAAEVNRQAIPRFEKLLKRPIFDGLSFLDKLKASEDPIDDLSLLKQLAEKEQNARSSPKASGKTLTDDGFLEQSTPLYESG